ncbi:MAG: hypothetical protein FJX76_10760 [Armatimonadetes bacterium]|nr:hypothetical protein [Armatimonadota bacterium]
MAEQVRIFRWTAGFLIALLVLWTGPAVATTEAEQVAVYLLDVQELSRMEHKAAEEAKQALRKVKARKMTADAYERLLDQQVIPDYKKFVLALKKIKTPNLEVLKVHKMVVEGAGCQMKAYVGQRDAIAANDVQKMKSANALMRRGIKFMADYIKAVDALKLKYGLK